MDTAFWKAYASSKKTEAVDVVQKYGKYENYGRSVKNNTEKLKFMSPV